MKVVDFPSVSMIEAEEAHFVTGSRLIPIRAMMPVFVFGSDVDAKAFVDTYGGTVHDYGQLKELSKKLREERGR